MKTLFAAFMVIVALSFASPSAFAQSVDRPLDFKALSECAGCVSFGEFTQDFGLLTEGYPAKVRFYYTSWYSDPTDQSEYIEMPIWVDSSGRVTTPEVTIGNFSSGQQYSFAYGLVSTEGNLLWFMKEEERDPDRHSVVVQ